MPSVQNAYILAKDVHHTMSTKEWPGYIHFVEDLAINLVSAEDFKKAFCCGCLTGEVGERLGRATLFPLIFKFIKPKRIIEIKEWSKRPGVRSNYLHQYLVRYLFVTSEGSDGNLHRFLKLAAEVYPPQTSRNRW